MTVLITLTTAGVDSGPFDLYSDLDGYISAFETGVSKASLLAGYSSALVPDGTTNIRIKSTGVCVNFIDIVLTTTTTSTSTTTSSSTTTTTTTIAPSLLESGAYSSSSEVLPENACLLTLDTNCWIDTSSTGVITTGDIVYSDVEGLFPIVGGNQFYKMSLVSSYSVSIDNFGVIAVNTICV